MLFKKDFFGVPGLPLILNDDYWTGLDKTYDRKLNAASELRRYVTRTLDDGSLLIEIDVPGVKKDAIEISAEKRQVTVTTTRNSTKTTENYYVKDQYDVSLMSAKLEDGVLTLSIPKSKGSLSKIIKIE